MSIPYSLTVRDVRPGMPELGNKTFAVAQSARVMDLNDLAEHMSSHDSKYNKGDVLAILTQLASCLREQLLLGNKVVLGDMGSFSVSLVSEGAPDVENFNTSQIKKVKVRWTPSSRLSDLIKDAQFQFVATRKAQQDARNADRERLQSMASGNGGQDTPGGGGDDELGE